MSEPKIITSDYTAKMGESIIADATNGPITITLPSPTSGQGLSVTKRGKHPVILDFGSVIGRDTP